MSRPCKRWLVLCAMCMCAIALPPSAGAAPAPRWQFYGDPAPGSISGELTEPRGSTLAVVGSTPYVTAIDTQGRLTVHQSVRRGTGWQQIGGVINHDPSQPAATPHLTVTGSIVWLTWVERDAQGVWQARLARREGPRFREIVGGDSPINDPSAGDAGEPRMALFEGRPYVSYIQLAAGAPRVHVARVRWGWRSFENVDAGLSPGNAVHPQLGVSDGRFYLLYSTYANATATDNSSHLQRINRARSGWDSIDTSGEPGLTNLLEDRGVLYASIFAADDSAVYRITRSGLAPVFPGAGAVSAIAAGVPYRMSTEEPAPEAPRELSMEVFLQGAWQPLVLPSEPGDDVGHSLAPVSAGGTLWLIFDSAHGLEVTTRPVHVARLVNAPRR